MSTTIAAPVPELTEVKTFVFTLQVEVPNPSQYWHLHHDANAFMNNSFMHFQRACGGLINSTVPKDCEWAYTSNHWRKEMQSFCHLSHHLPCGRTSPSSSGLSATRWRRSDEHSMELQPKIQCGRTFHLKLMHMTRKKLDDGSRFHCQ
jgi:hypothetical protein